MATKKQKTEENKTEETKCNFPIDLTEPTAETQKKINWLRLIGDIVKIVGGLLLGHNL